MIYLLFEYILLTKKVEHIGKDEYLLSNVTQIISSEELKNVWAAGSGSTLVFHINPTINDRTGVSGNEYANIVRIGSKQTFKMLAAPDAGRGLTMAPAILEIYVRGEDKPELVEIDNFPLQRWTAVAIVKRGRRFNIYLNGVLAASHTCTAMPDFDDTQGLKIGDPRMGGTISLISLSPTPLETNEVRDLVNDSVDTSGKPYMPFTIKSLFSFITPTIPSLPGGFWCPGGNCDIPKRAGPLEQWVSPYA
jgi:hypothetical protein